MVFVTQRQAIFASFARKHETSDFCFVTKEEVLVFEFQMFFEGTNITLMLACSHYYRVSFETIKSFSIFCNFHRIICVPDEHFYLVRKNRCTQYRYVCLICENKWSPKKMTRISSYITYEFFQDTGFELG